MIVKPIQRLRLLAMLMLEILVDVVNAVDAVGAAAIVPGTDAMQMASATVEPTIFGIPTTTALIGAGVLVAGYFLLGKKKPVAGKYRKDVG